MQVLTDNIERVKGIVYRTVIILYTDNTAYKRFYNLNGALEDSKPVKPGVIKRILRKQRGV